MNRQNEFEPRDLVIHFRDLVLYVALRWRSILLVALACMVLLGGFAYWQDVKLYNAAVNNTPQTVTHPDPDDAGLARVATVQNYRAAYASQCAYNQSAPMMRIDFMAVHTHRLSYLVTGEQAYVAATLYSKSLASRDLYAGLGEQDEDILPAYFAELLTVKLTYETEAAPAQCVFLDVEIIAPTKELCEQLSGLARETVSGLVAPVTKAVGKHAGSWVFDRYTVTGSESVRTRQLDSLKQQKQLQTDLATAEGELTATDRAYLNRLEKQEEKPTTGVAPAKPDLNVKMTVLGFLVGFVLMAMWRALRYLFCGRVLSENDLLTRHNVTVYGTLPGEKKRCFVDRLLCKWLQDKESDPFCVACQVALSVEAAALTSVYLMGDMHPDIAHELESRNINVIKGGNPADSGEGMEGLSCADGLVIGVRCGVTRHKDIARAIKVAKTLDCPVMGAIILK